MERKPVNEIKEMIASAAAENPEKTAEFIKRLLQLDDRKPAEKDEEEKK